MHDADADPAHPHLLLVRAYLAAIEHDASTAELSAFFTPDLQQREYPNRLVTKGADRTLDQVLTGRLRGREVVTDERYEIREALVHGDRVALELTWTARLRIPLGSLQAGSLLRADCGVFFTIRDGRIARQSNYDCFSPF